MDQRREAERTLEEVRRARAETRYANALDAAWVSYVLFGVLCLGAALAGGLFADGAGLGLYWAVAVPLALIILWQFYERIESERGVLSRYDEISGAILLVMVAAAFGLGFASEGELSAIGPLYPIALGLVAFYVLLRDPIDLFAGIGIAAVATILFAIDPGDPVPLAMLGEGLVLLVAGTSGLIRRNRSGNPVGRTAEPAET